ncbi:hypothetical protein GCM10010988_07570 [Cnuibacter physcomitrellae]|nr:hypothetical protein GCM10010988_07570 [Cnuibacter physcomitrellae]
MSPESETPSDQGSTGPDGAEARAPRARTAPRATGTKRPAAKTAAARTTAAKPQAAAKPRTPSKPQNPAKPTVQRPTKSTARPAARSASKAAPASAAPASTEPADGSITVEELFSDASAAPDLPQTVTVEVIEPTEPEAAPEPEPTEPTATAGPEAAAAAEPAGQAAPSAPSDADPLEPAPAKPARPASARKPSAPRAPAKSAAAPAAKVAPRRPAKPRPAARSKAAAAAVPSVVRDLDPSVIALSISGLTKRFGSTVAVAGIDLDVPQGSFYGIVGPNGAGKTTTLSMVTGMLRPDGGSITVLDTDVWRDPAAAKRLLGVLPDRLRLFDRLTGRQLLYYSGTLRKLDNKTVTARSADLAAALGLEDALGRLVSDYSAGMTKKLALACAMIHSPRVLVLDEPFESIDPVSAANVTEILEKYVAGGGTVVVSSHSMDMIQRVCDRVAIIVEGSVLAKGTVDEVRAGETLEERFMELAGTRRTTEGMEWLLSSSD